jgi:hypothetical protein
MGRALSSTLWRGVGFFVVLELMLVPALIYWPDFEKHIGKFRAMAPLPVMRNIIDTLETGGVFAYVTGQHFFKGCNTLGVAAAVLLSVGAVAGEAHRGTLELWLARPVSRARLLTERYVQGALAVCLPVFATTLTIPPILQQIGQDLPYGPLMWSALHTNLLLLAIYSFGFFCSTLSRSPLSIAFGLLFFTILQFAIYLVEKATQWSLFRLTDVERFLEIQGRGGLDPKLAGPLVLVSAALFVASLRAFARRTP